MEVESLYTNISTMGYKTSWILSLTEGELLTCQNVQAEYYVSIFNPTGILQIHWWPTINNQSRNFTKMSTPTTLQSTSDSYILYNTFWLWNTNNWLLIPFSLPPVINHSALMTFKQWYITICSNPNDLDKYLKDLRQAFLNLDNQRKMVNKNSKGQDHSMETTSTKPRKKNNRDALMILYKLNVQQQMLNYLQLSLWK